MLTVVQFCRDLGRKMKLYSDPGSRKIALSNRDLCGFLSSLPYNVLSSTDTHILCIWQVFLLDSYMMHCIIASVFKALFTCVSAVFN